jgi:Helix-turn-helix domain
MDDFTWGLDNPDFRRMMELAADPDFRRMMELAADPRAQSFMNPGFHETLKLHHDFRALYARRMGELFLPPRNGGAWPAEPKAAPEPPHPGLAVKALRKRRKWSQEKLAGISGVSLRTISDLERLRRIPKPANVTAVLEALEKTDH